MRIAYFSPLNPMKTGIADYSEELLPYLARYAEIDLFVDGDAPANPEIGRSFAVHDYLLYEKLRRRGKYDVALYQMGNNPCHEYIYRTMQQYPGVTVLHDHTLHHFMVEITLGRGNPDEYLREMAHAHGERGIQAAHRALRGGCTFPVWEFPLSRRVVESSLGVVVHSGHCARLIGETMPLVPLARIPHGMDVPAGPRCSKEDLGLDPDSFVVASFGLATPEKRIDIALRAFKELLGHVPNAVYLAVGQIPEWHDVRALVDDLELGAAVRLVGFVDKRDLQKYIEVADVCVNLRYPTAGETSGIALRAMAAAKPIIVSNVGSYAELPDDACLKIAPDKAEVEVLAKRLCWLAANPVRRGLMGARALAYIREQHDRDRVAREYIRFLQSLLGASKTDAGNLSSGHAMDVEPGHAQSNVIDVVRGIRAAARGGATPAPAQAASARESDRDVALGKHLDVVEVAAASIFVGEQLRPPRTRGDGLRYRLKRPFHSLVRYYLDLTAQDQAEFNGSAATALRAIEQACGAKVPGVLDGDQRVDSRLESLRERTARLEEELDRLRGEA